GVRHGDLGRGCREDPEGLRRRGVHRGAPAVAKAPMAIPSVDELGERLGIVLRDREAIAQAFVHSSYFNENPTLVDGHNERLEFLGDAVIGLVVSRLLYERFPDEDEGFLTARRAALVNRHALAAMALELGLDQYLLLGRGQAEAGGATRPSLLAAGSGEPVLEGDSDESPRIS